MQPERGTFDKNYDIATVLHDVWRRQVTGQIELSSHHHQKSLFFERGHPVSAFSSQVYDRMEEFLFREGNAFGAAVGLWWLGQSLMDLAPYINDARALALPLLFSISDPQSLNRYVLSASSDAFALLLTGYAVAFLVMLVPAILIGMRGQPTDGVDAGPEILGHARCQGHGRAVALYGHIDAVEGIDVGAGGGKALQGVQRPGMGPAAVHGGNDL